MLKITPLRVIIALVGLFLFIGAIVLSVNWFQARNLDKERKQYEVDRAAWATERAGHITRAEEAEKRAASLEPKAAAFDTLVGQKKVIDAGLAKKIEEVSTNAANAEANAEGPVPCLVRAQRICDMFRAGNQRFDCSPIFAECSRQ